MGGGGGGSNYLEKPLPSATTQLKFPLVSINADVCVAVDVTKAVVVVVVVLACWMAQMIGLTSEHCLTPQNWLKKPQW